MGTYTAEDVAAAYIGLTNVARARLRFTSPLVGGQPAQRPGIEAYVSHHLGLSELDARGKRVLTDEGRAAVSRILDEEVGERDITPDTGEVNEREVYSVTVVRHDDYGAFLGDWQVKACLKQAASRLGLWVKKRGAKGDCAEMGRATAFGPSLIEGSDPHRIHIVTPDGRPVTDREFERIQGRVHTPAGAKSIVTDSEIIRPGHEAFIEFRWKAGKIGEDDMLAIWAAASNCGLGSARSLERGRFEVVELEINVAKKAGKKT